MDYHGEDTDSVLSCPIHLLPVELLVRCFVFAINSIIVHARCESGQALALSHVCQRWRDATLEGRELWIFVPLFSKEIAELYMQRSCPLTVTACYSYSKITTQERYREAYTWLLEKELTRVYGLVHARSKESWLVKDEENQDVWDDALLANMDAPQMKLLHLVKVSNFELPPFNDGESGHSSTPLLYALHIKTSKLPRHVLPILRSPMLTKLAFNLCEDTFPCLFKSSEWMPSLKHLTINENFNRAPFLDYPERFTLPLTLDFLSICARSVNSMFFLQNAELSLRTTLHVTSVDNVVPNLIGFGRHLRETTPAFIPGLIGVIFSRLTATLALGEQYDCLTVADSGSDAVDIGLWNSPPPQNSPVGVYTGHQYSSSWRYTHGGRMATETSRSFVPMILMHMSRIPGSHTLTKLCVNLNGGGSMIQRNMDIWVQLATGYPNVTEIVTDSSALVYVLAEAAFVGQWSALTLVIVSGPGPWRNEILNKAKDLRKGIRFARLELLSSLPDHCLPFDDDLD